MNDQQTNREAQRRVVAIASLGEMFRATLSEVTLGLYVAATSELDPGQFDAAVTRAARECRFMPAAAELREFGFGATDDDAAEAWHVVEKAVRSLGPSRSPNFGDAIIHGSIRRLGGWIRLAESGADEWPFLRKEFLSHHRRLTINGCPPEDGKRLIGISEQTNRSNGFEEQANRSIYIVDRQGKTARAVDVLPPEAIARMSMPGSETTKAEPDRVLAGKTGTEPESADSIRHIKPR